VSEVGDHLCDLLASPLRSHVANTLDREEVESLITLVVASNLAVGEPWSPLGGDWPVELLNPLLSAIGRDGSISITRVEHELDSVLEDAVDPHGCLILHVVVQGGGALLPDWSAVWNVEGSSHLWKVHVVSKIVTKDYVTVLGVSNVRGERSILSHGVASFVGSLFTANDCSSIALLWLQWVNGVVLSVEIVPVELSSQFIEFGSDSLALWSLGSWSDTLEVSDTSVVFCLLPEGHWNNVHVGDSGHERGPHVISPVSGTVSNHGSPEWNVEEVLPELSLLVVLEDLPSQVWYIDSSIALTRDP